MLNAFMRNDRIENCKGKSFAEKEALGIYKKPGHTRKTSLTDMTKKKLRPGITGRVV